MQVDENQAGLVVEVHSGHAYPVLLAGALTNASTLSIGRGELVVVMARIDGRGGSSTVDSVYRSAYCLYTASPTGTSAGVASSTG